MEPNKTPRPLAITTAIHSQLPHHDAWITAARNVLIATGIESVDIEHLARILKTDSNSFYHSFKDREELLHELLQHWIANNTRAYRDIVDNSEDSSVAKLDAINSLWLEGTVDPGYDLAIRDWARISETVAKAVRYADKTRINALKSVFLDLDYDEESAFVRAQAAYFHQIGHFMLGLDKSTQTHPAHAPIFLEMILSK